MREFGRSCGRAFLHAEDLLALRGERTRLDTTRKGMVEVRISAVPEAVPAKRAKAMAASSPQCRARTCVVRHIRIARPVV